MFKILYTESYCMVLGFGRIPVTYPEFLVTFIPCQKSNRPICLCCYNFHNIFRSVGTYDYRNSH